MSTAAILAAAKAAAATAVVANGAAVPDYTPPANYTPARQMPSLRESVDASGLQVDAFLTVTPDGMRVGKSMDLFKSIVLDIDFSEVIPTMNVRGEIGGRASYARTADGKTTAQGKSWDSELAYFQKNSDPSKYQEYTSYEIPMTLATDIVDDKKVVLFEAGTTVGFTPAERGSKEFAKFFKKTPTDIEERGSVAVKLTHSKRVGAQAYGVATFELVLN